MNMKCINALLFITFTAAGIAAQTPGQNPGAILRELSGRVEVMTPGSAVWVPAEAGMAIEQAALVSTGFRSTATLALGNSTITVQPLTRLSLEEIIELQGNEQVSVYLRTGKVRAEVRPPVAGKIDFTVRSPVVTASVRGTVFDFDTVNLNVTEGRVEFAAAGSLALVREGEASSADETRFTVSAPAEEKAAALSPALPPGTERGGAGGGASPINPQGSLDLTLSLEPAP
ncbi:MAG: FecR domain-containing protein [Treponema sp.]|jgi:hypothetical protein|nr:FecR domain-containing protein [Treponema sp.]